VVELRRYQRAPIDVPVEFSAKGATARGSGKAKDISVGGMFLETTSPLPFGSDLVVHVTLPGQKAPFAIPAVVRWLGGGGMGVQFGLIGARETHAITELTKEA
jgi:type IV pilus assembly protein PilZ